MSALRDAVRDIDRELLRAQKSWLCSVGIELAEGVVCLFDAIQDAVRLGLAGGAGQAAAPSRSGGR
jgi:hypothetical protein